MLRHRTRAVLIAAATATLAVPRPSQAVIFLSTGDNTYNTTAPTGALADSGWQYQGFFAGFYTGTPISTHSFIAAHHIGGSVGAIFTFDNVSYTTTSFTDIPGTDLRVWQVSGTLPTYAPIWNTSTDGSESGQPMVVMGRGTERGDPILLPQGTGQLRGWMWGNDTHVLRWGQNIVTGFSDFATTGDQKLLEFDFDQPGTPGYSGVNESALSVGDSSGGVFIKSGNQWKLAGINLGVDGPFNYTSDASTDFVAPLFDATGFYYFPTPTNPVLLQPNPDGSPIPTGSYASRISPNLAALMPFLSPTWNVDNAGNWSTSSNWQAGLVPNGVDSEANFRGAISTARTVIVDSARTVGNIYFDNTARYTLAGANTITMAVSSGSAGITVYSGSPVISAPVSLVSNTNINIVASNSTLTMSGGLSAVGAASLTKQGAGILAVPNLRMNSLTLSGGIVHVLPGRTSATTSILSSAPVITGGAQLDLEDNALIVNYGSDTTGATRDAIRNLLINGRNAGPGQPAPWNGASGITSSFVHNNGNGFNLAIGYADNATLASINAAGSYTSFGGQVVSSNTILVQMTYGADANLDGKVDGSDVSIIGTHFNQPGSGQWYYGDFDYSGMCDGNDISVLGSTFGQSSPALSPVQLTAEFGSAFTAAFQQGQSAVPEPTSGVILGIASLAMLRRRRR